MKGPSVSPADFAAMRRAMVESQLRTAAVDDACLITALASVPRERFVPGDKAALAYADMTLPVAGDREMNLPMATARLLDALALEPDDEMLVIGAGAGYAAAVASKLAARVVALECEPALVAIARVALADYPNVALVEGALAEGWPANAPYDAILLDGAVEQLPGAIIAQLAERGRLAGALIDRGVTRLALGRNQGGAFGVASFADAEAALLPGFARAREFVF